VKPDICSDIDGTVARPEKMRDKYKLERLVCRVGSQEMRDRIVAAVKVHGPWANACHSRPEERDEEKIGSSQKWKSPSEARPARLTDYR
jgi:hypothetical protein